MDPSEQTRTLFHALEQQDWHTVRTMISDDFHYLGPTPDPFDKETWLDFQMAVHAAFPDWQYNLQEVTQNGNRVDIKVHITATHTDTLTLPLENVPPLPATGKQIELPIETAHLEFTNGKISKLVVDQQLYGSLSGLLSQLGME